MGALRKLPDRGDQLGDLRLRLRMTEDRQREGRLGDEDIAGHRHEGRAGRVGAALVVAGGDDPQPVRLDGDLRRAENMTGGMESGARAAKRQRLTIGDRLGRAGEARSVASLHDLQRFHGCQHRAVAGASVIGMAVGDQRARDRPRRVDMEVAGRAIKAGGRGAEQVFRAHRRTIGACRRRVSRVRTACVRRIAGHADGREGGGAIPLSG